MRNPHHSANYRLFPFFPILRYCILPGTVQYKVLDIAHSFCMSYSDQHNSHVKEIHVNVVKVRNILSDGKIYVWSLVFH